ncbi:glycine-rich domain-containing protein [Mycobacteroides abscessus]|uniref:glycine-rich domain-containing protein n=1 Tax=Mycobacteroides abscessus TaxID=36809 RepID=UPI000928B666|nr:hypothetical protein [Mycobacteroides abscessus]DAZ90357.1 TPA_asm: minor tail protein [Mycobacterium phage prophiFSQJ01-1]SII41564.1 Bacteriophage protein [Mycobacteroides abscessus subsp. abscessus]SIK13579.1 Bacteriophage protein [Mycobacteroides abscessus subsp. abscessus]SIN25721.1 Bacteriophage protein [Mycobacteroides abscessus subsp. abscessus]SLI51213.1 Bacteriophage protein [Mycobacteroides abscessus subsp. abscessus]
MTQPDGFNPDQAANYDSLADWAAMTEADWRTKYNAPYQSAIDKFTGGFFGGLPTNMPHSLAMLTALVRRLIGNPSITFPTPEQALDALFQIPIIGDIAEVIMTVLKDAPLNAANLFGQILPNRLGAIPLAQVVDINPELLTNPHFEGVESMSGQSIWFWDDTEGHGEPGCARTEADGTEKELLSNYITVAPGQKLRAFTWAKWSGLVASGNAITLQFAMYDANGAPLGALDVDHFTAPTGTHGWSQIVGTVTIPANVFAVRLRLCVKADALAGTIWFDDGSVKATDVPTWLADAWDRVQQVVNSAWTAITGLPAAVDKTLAELIHALQNIPQINVIGLPLLQTVQNQINDVLAGNIVTPINQVVQDVKDWFAGLGQQVQHLTSSGTLSPIHVGSPVGGTSLGSDFGKVMDGFWNVIFGDTATGKNTDDFATATAALKQTADDAKAAAIYASDLINLPRRSPRWLSTGTHDDVSFPIINATSTFTPALGKLVLIPITPDVARVYKSAKIGITGTTMTQLFVGIYRIDSGGIIVLDTNLGNVKSSVTASKVQTFAIPDPYLAVDRGETVFIGALQVGGTAAPILTNNAMLSVLESVQPVPLFFTQDGGGSLSSLPSSVGTSVELNPAWGALGEVLIESQWTDFNYTGGPGYSGQWFTYTIPSTSRYLYLVGLGAGGAGGGGDGGAGYSGEGGRAGQWVAKRIERGVDIDWGVTTLSVLVTNGGIYTEKETAGGPGGGSNRTYNWYHTTTTNGFPRYASGIALSRNDSQLYYANADTPPSGTQPLLLAPSGNGGRGSWFNGAFTPDGQSPGNFAFGGRLFIGAAAIPGTPPGVGADSAGIGGGGQGGHGGSGGNGTRGGAGSPGLVAIKAV